MQALISRGITRLIRTGSNLINREAPALSSFPERTASSSCPPTCSCVICDQKGLPGQQAVRAYVNRSKPHRHFMIFHQQTGTKIALI